MPLQDPDSLDAERNAPRGATAETPSALPLPGSDSPAALDPETLSAPFSPPSEEGYPVDTPSLADLPHPTTRQIHGEVWALAWPSVVTMLLQTVNSLMDTLFVGHLPNGAHALAATGVGGSVIFLLISLAMGVSVGTTALVARFTGAHDHKNASLATGQSLTLSLALGLFFGVTFYLGRGSLIGWMLNAQSSPEAARLGVAFLSIALLGAAPLFVMNVLMGAL